jgi:microcin C transport system permease protein
MDAPVIEKPNPAPAATASIARPLSLADKLRRQLTLSPLNQRRWQKFKSNRRGYWSLIAFAALFVVTLFAELIANDKPILVRYKGETYYPVFAYYPESTFGGFRAITDYKDPEIETEIRDNGWALWPPISYRYDSINTNYPQLKGKGGICLGFPAPPQWATSLDPCPATVDQLQRFNAIGNRNWLGTDDRGRDVLSRLIYGFRISILFGLLLTALAAAIGITVGAMQGYFGGVFDLIAQRILEIWSSMPFLFVMLIISSVLVPGFWTLLGVLLLFQWTQLVGVVRAEFLRGRNLEYITAARALGLSDAKIMFKHLLPNAMVATMTFMPFKLSGSISSLTALDFLGLGLPSGSPSLGEMLTQATANLQAPWLGLAAFLSIASLLSLLIFIGEGVRDALDPRKNAQ